MKYTIPLISIIIPCYNYGHYLSETLSCLNLQTFTNWECIIVDDGSTDSTREIVEGFSQTDNRYNYIYIPHQGVSCARNAGVTSSKGMFIQFLDADDLLEPDKLSIHSAFLAANPSIDIVYGDWKYFDSLRPEGLPLYIESENLPWRPGLSGCGEQILKGLLIDNLLVISAPLIKKTLFKEIGGFNESLCMHEDWDFWLRCAVAGGVFSYLEHKNTDTVIRLHNNSLSRNRLAMHSTNILVRQGIHQCLKEKQLQTINVNGIRAIEILLAVELIKQRRFAVENLPLLRSLFTLPGLGMFSKLVAARIHSLPK